MHKLARLTPLGRLRMIRRLEAGERLRDVAAAIDLSPTTVRRLRILWGNPSGFDSRRSH